MQKEDFSEILEKYLSGRATDEEIQIVEDWYSAMGASQSAKPGQGVNNEEQQGARYLANIMQHVGESERKGLEAPRSRFFLPAYVSAIAACILLIIAVVFLIPKKEAITGPATVAQESYGATWHEETNEGPKAKQLKLPDGSKVVLERNSSLRYSIEFDVLNREVFLEGEAFFEVNPDPLKPFMVYANDVITRVLGTSFTVRSYRHDEQVKVVVKTGKVSVFAHGDTTRNSAEEIILTPNQEMIYNRSEKLVQRRLVEEPQQIVSGQTENLRFEDAPLKEIIRAIEQVYGVEIEYDEEKFATCVLTTSVTSGGLYNRMDIITTAIGATYELKDDRIVINGSGCDHNIDKKH